MATATTTFEPAQEIIDLVRACAQRSYQRDLLAGRESWSGASLRGKARSYGGRYKASRENLIARINVALKPFGLRAESQLVTTDRQRRELVLIDIDGAIHVW